MLSESPDTATAVAGLAPSATGRRIPVSTYRLQFHAGFTFADARGARCRTSTRSASRTLLLAVPAGACRAARTATTSPIRRAQPGDRHRGGVRGVRRRAARARHGPGARRRAEPHGHRAVGEPLVEGRARERPELALRASSSTSTGSRSSRSSHDKVLLPILGDQYGAVLERGELQLAFAGRRVLPALLRHDAPGRAAHRTCGSSRHRIDALTRELGEEHRAI